MPQLFLRPQTAGDAETGEGFAAEWLIRDAAGTTFGVADADELAALAQRHETWLADPRNVILLAPVEHVVCLARSVPGRSAGQIRRALPFAVEEFLAQDVETMHLAHAPIVRGQPARCALIDDATLANWLESLAAGGIAPGFAVPDASLLPDEPDAMTALLDDTGALVRAAEQMARIDHASLPEVLGSALQGIDSSLPALRLFGARAEIDKIASALPPERVQCIPLTDGPLEFLASRWSPQAARINLLQGRYAPSKKRRAGVMQWRGVAALAALWGAVFIGAQLAEGFWADREAERLRADAVALYRQIYPAEGPAADVYAMMRRRLGEAGDASGDFHLLLGRLATGLGESTGGGRLRSLSFSEERAELAAEVRLAGYAELDRLTAGLEGQRLAVEIGSAEEREDRVHARLRLELAQ